MPVALTALAIALLWVATPLAPGRCARLRALRRLLCRGRRCFVFAGRRVRLAMALAGFLLLPAYVDASGSLMMARSFFGVHRVRSLSNEDLVVLQHGTTIHGMQSPGQARS